MARRPCPQSVWPGGQQRTAIRRHRHAVQGASRRPVVLCAIGDGTAQQGEVLEAIGAAVRDTLPVLFLIEDNHYAISSPTRGRTFYSLPNGLATDFHGIAIEYVDGGQPLECHRSFGRIIARMRQDRRPQIVVMNVERLCDHTHADDQARYRDPTDIARAKTLADPITNLETTLLSLGLGPAVLSAARDQAHGEARAGAERVRHIPLGQSPASNPLPNTSTVREYRGTAEDRTHTLLMAVRATLDAQLRADPRVCLYGQDIEDPKGDVFGVTSGLSTAFPGRVCDAPLSESTIVGTAVGRALAGGRPVAFLQFADFLPLAFNQIAAELGSMHWRTDGAWRCPVILMVPCGGYRPGLGPFHAQSLESIVAHVPGVQVVMPSNAADAAGLLNAAFNSETPTVFFYPKACLNDRSQTTSADVTGHYVHFGRARVERTGIDLTLVSYGNGMARCREVADTVKHAGGEVELIDLRSLSPWDHETVIQSVARTRRLVIVHEDNRTCGMGAEIAATVSERLGAEFTVRRVVRDDAYIACNFDDQLAQLPSYRSVLEAVAELTGFDLTWTEPTASAPDEWVVCALGSGPSDEVVTVTGIAVTPGQDVAAGQVVASVEASKSCV
ncbi:MAG: transketolase, partial [Betaproteobacteria bacterium]|nr:transketolase [Betaproteobacteria bacterium]